MPKLRAHIQLCGDYGAVHAGDIFTASERVAVSLESRGLAQRYYECPISDVLAEIRARAETYLTKVIAPAPPAPAAMIEEKVADPAPPEEFRPTVPQPRRRGRPPKIR